MYKKITHQITEEHFDHPMAADIKKFVEVPEPIKSKGYYISDSYYMLSQFEKQNIHAWSKLSHRLNDLVVSITSANMDTAALTAQLIEDVAVIGRSMEPIATAEQIAQFNSAVATWATTLFTLISNIPADRDTVTDRDALKSIIDTIAGFLNSLSPVWDSAAVASILTAISDAYINQAKARYNKEWVYSVKQSDLAYNTLVVQQLDGKPSFSDIFSSGFVLMSPKTVPEPTKENL